MYPANNCSACVDILNFKGTDSKTFTTRMDTKGASNLENVNTTVSLSVDASCCRQKCKHLPAIT